MAFLLEDLEPALSERGFESSWGFLTARAGTGREFACLVEPPASTARLEVQSGAFTLSSSNQKSLETLLESAGMTNALEQLVIPARRVDIIRDQLDLCEIDERHLFPGLDGIAAQLHRYYSSSRQEPPLR